jgi:hypothetical protein
MGYIKLDVERANREKQRQLSLIDMAAATHTPASLMDATIPSDLVRRLARILFVDDEGAPMASVLRE